MSAEVGFLTLLIVLPSSPAGWTNIWVHIEQDELELGPTIPLSETVPAGQHY